jgi:hypothetical protein
VIVEVYRQRLDRSYSWDGPYRVVEENADSVRVLPAWTLLGSAGDPVPVWWPRSRTRVGTLETAPEAVSRPPRRQARRGKTGA